ncbi:unnamed protein product, partial [Urochloa humidicola]
TLYQRPKPLAEQPTSHSVQAVQLLSSRPSTTQHSSTVQVPAPAEMRRCSRISSSLAALVLLLLLRFFHRAAAARSLPDAVPLVHQENGARVVADGEPVLHKGAVGGGDELSSVSEAEVMGAEEEPACEEGNEECMQRRLLHDAHLDYIYTQHKGKP